MKRAAAGSLQACGAAVLLLLAVADGHAQPFPAKPLRIVVPYAPGGPTDILSRLVGQKLAEAWGQPVVVENRPGAAGMTGSALVAKASPDGYTMVTAGLTFVTAPLLDAKLGFSPQRELLPIALMGSIAQVVVVHPSLPIRTIGELVALGRSRPSEILYASGGGGGTQHLAGEYFKHLTGVKLVHVPYKGSAPGLTALIGGEVALGFTDTMITVPHIRSGKLRAIAVTGARRTRLLPELPTVAEAGVRGYSVDTWFGLALPVATPRELVQKLNGEIVKGLQSPDVHERLTALGLEPGSLTAEQFGDFVRAEAEKWARVIRAAGIRGD